jgi:YidC/Oxa1 family membrane protein insertase
MLQNRLFPFLLFLGSCLLLWQSWQKEHPVTPKDISAIHQSSLPSANVIGGTAVPAQPTLGLSQLQNNLKSGQIYHISTPLLDVDIDSMGADVRGLALKQQLDSNNQPLVLFADKGPLIEVAQSGLIGAADVPNHTTPYQLLNTVSDFSVASNGAPLDVSFQATSLSGIQVIKTFHFTSDSYVIRVDEKIINHSEKPASLQVYYQILRNSDAPSHDPRFVSTFTGPAVYTESSKYQKISFKDIDNNKINYPTQSNNGWIGMVQHYFVAAWIPPNNISRDFYTRQVAEHLYAAGTVIPLSVIQPNAEQQMSVSLYAGPEEKKLLESVAPGLKYTVDYGWLTIFAEPLFSVLSWLHGWVHNWGVSIILLTFLIKLCFFPLTATSFKSMAKMRRFQPKMNDIKALCGDDKAKYNQMIMELYRKEKINPLGGCLPIVIQMPVFFSLYWMILGAVQLRHAPFFAWIHDLSAQDPYYILPVLMAASMIVQQRLSPKPADPMQAKVMMYMPLIFSVTFLFFPSGLVLYWVVNNVLSILQQWQINRMMGNATPK